MAVRRVLKTASAWGFPLALVMTLVMLWLHDGTLMRTANHLAYDRFVRVDARFSIAPAHVMLVYADPTLEDQPDQYLEMLRQLRESTAARIGVAQLDARSWPAEQRFALRQMALATDESPEIVFGDLLLPPDELRAFQTGDIRLIHSADGVYRWSRGREDDRDSFEVALAQPFGKVTAAVVPDGRFGVRFRGGVESLPHITADALLNREVTESLLRDRIVLVGRPSSELAPGVSTPTTDVDRMSVLEFHGHALNTLVCNFPLFETNRHWNPPLFFLSAIVFLAMGRRMRLDRTIFTLGLCWTVQALVVLLLLWVFGLFLPVLSLMAVQTMGLAWSLEQRMGYSERAWQMLRRRGFNVSPRYKSHPHLAAGDEPWTEIAELLHQLFPVNCVSILLRSGRRDHLTLSVTLGSEDARVEERRRDMSRAPFADVVDRKTALRIDQERPFFDLTDGAQQYMAPVFHAGILKAIVAVEISELALQRVPDFTSQLTEVCDEIAGWFARYEELLKSDVSAKRWWNRWATHPEIELFTKLNRHLRGIERRLHQSFAVVENASIGKAVFDLSGKVLTINAAMFRMLHRYGLGSTEVRLLSIVRAFSKRDVLECRELIRRTLVEGRRERIIATDPEDSEDPLVLVIQPLAKSAQMVDDPEEMDAFEAHGVQIEIFSADLLGDVHQVRERVTETGLDTIAGHLSDLETIVRNGKVSADAWHQVRRNLDLAQQTVRQCQAMLSNSESEDPQMVLPVQLEDLVRSAVADSQSMIDKHGATISTDVAADLPDVLANPHRLREAISICLHALVQNARDNSLINIAAKLEADSVVVRLENEGCGVAIDRLSNLREISRGRSSGDSARLDILSEWLATWDGEFKVVSHLGEGAVLTLRLNRFRWQLVCDESRVDTLAAFHSTDPPNSSFNVVRAADSAAT